MITRELSATADVTAPDGSEVRLLATSPRGSMAHFRLLKGQTSLAVVHRTVEELWYVTAGHGEIWRKTADAESITALRPGVSVSIAVGTRFQFRNTGKSPLDIVGVTMPPWPGMDEAVLAPGAW